MDGTGRVEVARRGLGRVGRREYISVGRKSTVDPHPHRLPSSLLRTYLRHPILVLVLYLLVHTYAVVCFFFRLRRCCFVALGRLDTLSSPVPVFALCCSLVHVYLLPSYCGLPHTSCPPGGCSSMP